MTANTSSPAQRPRVVVIGAGIGGLCAAVRLSHGGCSVTVVDGRPSVGGKMRCIASAAGPVDAGPTVLTLRAVFDAVFAAAGTRLEDHLTLIPQPILARHWWDDGSTLDLHADRDTNADAIRIFAGAQAEAQFRRFDALTAQAFAAFDAPLMQAARPQFGTIARAALRRPRLWPLLLPGMTLARALALQFSDPRLRQLFGRYATYVGGSPFQSPAVLGLVWQAEARGVWAVQGGMHRLAQALQSLAEAGGARFRFGTMAERITDQWGQINSVVLTDGSSLPADHVVFNGDPAALAAGLLGKAARRATPPLATVPRSLSANVWTFAATPQGPVGPQGLIHHNVFFAHDPKAEFGPIAQGHLPTDPTLYVCAQDRTGTEAPEGPERFEIILNAPSGLAHNAGDAHRCRDLTLSQLARFGLRFSPMPDPETEPTALTTPARFARMFPASGGAIYGRSPHGLMAAFQRPGARTALTGLYLAGGGAHPGAGVPMAARSGLHAAEAILTDLALGSASGRMAMPGGTSTGSAPVAAMRFPSSGS